MQARFAIVAAAALISGPAWSQDSADPRALEACQAGGATFVQIADCLPDAHVAFKVLDAFENIYPAEALPLKARCTELNDTVTATATCVTEAISTGVGLAATLPAGTEIEDPVFNAVKDGALLAKLDAVEKEAKATFPEKLFWGGGMYHPYQ